MKGKFITLITTGVILALASNVAVAQTTEENPQKKLRSDVMKILCEKSPLNSRCQGQKPTTEAPTTETETTPTMEETITPENTTPDSSTTPQESPSEIPSNVTPLPNPTPEEAPSNITPLPTPNSEDTEMNQTPASDEMPDKKMDDTNKAPVPGAMEEKPVNTPEAENSSPESDDSK
ncbi:MAG: hypothetical protein QNJ36_09350 [Calothrix sp. MO_167.B42]|nr:hypothetical protein [Calothrix sp. MO_167.B42]